MLEGFAAGFDAGFAAGFDDCPEGLLTDPDVLEELVPDERPEDLVYVVPDVFELVRDCASISGMKAANANPVSIAANVLADNLMIFQI